MNELDQLFQEIHAGVDGASDRLWPLVYSELRLIATAKLAHETPGQTLQPTALVHEAWMRLGGSTSHPWQGRSHFFAAAAEAMRRILVDRARQKNGARRGGTVDGEKRKRIELDDSVVSYLSKDEELLAINEALDQLAAESPIKAELVKLRFFVGLDEQEAATVLGISRATATRYWAYSKAFLFEALHT